VEKGGNCGTHLGSLHLTHFFGFELVFVCTDPTIPDHLNHFKNAFVVSPFFGVIYYTSCGFFFSFFLFFPCLVTQNDVPQNLREARRNENKIKTKAKMHFVMFCCNDRSMLLIQPPESLIIVIIMMLQY